MKAILDTEAFLHWIMDAERLSDTAYSLIENADNEIYLSSASAMEISHKIKMRHIIVNNPLAFITEQMNLNMIKPLPIDVSHALYVAKLPNFHQDPYDRLLVSQAILESLPIITSDSKLEPYDVKLIW
jgi:PIN domain nuclease of toxin-antitoxin system